MKRFEITVHFNGAYDHPEMKEFYLVAPNLDYRFVCEQLALVLDKTGHVITRIEITPGGNVL
jgi:hypothetical protein